MTRLPQTDAARGYRSDPGDQDRAERHRLLVESSLGLICTHDREGRLLSINPAGADLLGYPRSELLGQRLHSVIPEQHHPEIEAYLERLILNGQDRGIMRVVRSDGSHRLWSFANRWVESSTGSYALGHAQDVTELLRIRSQLRKLAEVDATTGLPNRRSFMASLDAALETPGADAPPILMLLNPVDFRSVNDRFGRPAGDQALAEIGQRLRKAQDIETAHYGGATFAGLLFTQPETAAEQARSLREALSFHPYLGGALRLEFAVGLARLNSEEATRGDAALVLGQKASVGLRQAQAQGGGVVTSDELTSGEEPLDSLSGIFTTDLSTDYRNMLLMWNVLEVLSQHAEPRQIAREILRILVAPFSLTRARLVNPAPHEGAPWIEEEPSSNAPPAIEPDLAKALLDLQRSRDLVALYDLGGGRQRALLALVAHKRPQGFLVLEGRSGHMHLDETDLFSLKALATHIASALDRATLAERERRLRQHRSEILEQEVDELRDVVTRKVMVYRSPAMAHLMEKARRIAATDASVLVTGQSGTGKEVVAHVLHDLSPRRTQEPVVVDLSTLSSQIIASELFGHVRGAFTGADSESPGRLAQADGSTVILDEIGELPLEVQAKLLRFVQEKEIVPVGGHEVRRVDARIVACTNRDLAAEVEAGRFREDLFHRLNVLRLHVPPLTRRREDVTALAEHFIQTLSAQHGLRRTLSEPAIEALLRYDWPGNVRELQNRLLRAVVLSPERIITMGDLDLPKPDRASLDAVREDLSTGLRRAFQGDLSTETDAGAADATAPVNVEDDPFAVLDRLLDDLIAAELASPPPFQPVGEAVAADLLRRADESTDEVVSQAAKLLDLPETTYRRRLSKLPDNEPDPTPTRRALAAHLERLMDQAGGPGSQLFERVERAFMKRLLHRLSDDPRTAATLAGLSLPTLRRWRRDLDL